jgi:tRNA pseudouridine38-40 synthase
MYPIIRLTFEFNGAPFIGWQRNPQGVSVQQVVEEALAIYFRVERVLVRASGRTDTGVHAEGLVASFRPPPASPTPFNPDSVKDLTRLWRSLNGLLPRAVSLLEVARMPDGFDATRHADYKVYRYSIWNSCVRSPLREGRVWQVFLPLDVEAMKEASAYFPGEHDFKGFRGRRSNAKTSLRFIDECRIEVDGRAIDVFVKGHGFLKHMVRNMVGTLVDIGLHQMTVEDIPKVLESGDRRDAGRRAPASGLTLLEVAYAPPWDSPLLVIREAPDIPAWPRHD